MIEFFGWLGRVVYLVEVVVNFPNFPFEVLDATGCLHQRGILHRDLATKNVLPGKPKWKVSQQKLNTWDLHFGHLWKNFTQWNEDIIGEIIRMIVYGSFDFCRSYFVMNQLAVQQGSTSVERSKFVTLASREWPLARNRKQLPWDLEKWMSGQWILDHFQLHDTQMLLFWLGNILGVFITADLGSIELHLWKTPGWWPGLCFCQGLSICSVIEVYYLFNFCMFVWFCVWTYVLIPLQHKTGHFSQCF